ncbi:MAG: hypothetical protein WC523_01580 [Patescibacteria group bacterium]|jgi:hypothetical protein
MPKNTQKTIKEIEEIFQQTISKLQALHQQKMELIQYYSDLENKNELEKVRQGIKKN